jgi:hypothetical protein
LDFRYNKWLCKNQPNRNPITNVKNISNALDIEARQNKTPISTTFEFCAIDSTAMLPSMSTIVNLKFKLFIPSNGQSKASDVTNVFGDAGLEFIPGHVSSTAMNHISGFETISNLFIFFSL